MEAVKQLSVGHLALGHQVEIACVDAPGATFLAGFPVATHALGPGRSGYGYAPRLAPWLAEQRRRFDVVVVNGLWQYPGLAAWRVLAVSDTPYVVMTHGMLDPWFKRRYPLKHLKKWLYWPWGEYRVLRDARLVLFTTEEEKLVSRRSFWLYRANEHVVNCGTAPPPDDAEGQRLAFLAAFPALATTRNLLFLGRIQEKKGCDLLVRAFAACAHRDPRLRLVMAGPDQDGWRPALEAIAAQAGVAGRITWTGMVQGAMKWGAFRCAEAFVLPSHQENFGIAVAEALACGVPALISNKVNIWREVENDGGGLIANDDLPATTAMLGRWLELGEAGRAAMAAAARASFAARFHIDVASASMLAAFAKACAQPTAPPIPVTTP
jgi:glycosyltransferase involved in cell wall biosynthesis